MIAKTSIDHELCFSSLIGTSGEEGFTMEEYEGPMVDFAL